MVGGWCHPPFTEQGKGALAPLGPSGGLPPPDPSGLTLPSVLTLSTLEGRGPPGAPPPASGGHPSRILARLSFATAPGLASESGMWALIATLRSLAPARLRRRWRFAPGFAPGGARPGPGVRPSPGYSPSAWAFGLAGPPAARAWGPPQKAPVPWRLRSPRPGGAFCSRAPGGSARGAFPAFGLSFLRGGSPPSGGLSVAPRARSRAFFLPSLGGPRGGVKTCFPLRRKRRGVFLEL